MTTSIFAVGK